MDIGFIIKKIITFFVEPMGFVLTLFLIGLYFLFRAKTRYAKIFLSATFSFLFLFSYQPFSNMLVKNLENSYQRYDYKNSVKYIHVLGGDPKRVIEGIIIYRNMPDSKLIFTGYAGNAKISTAQFNANLANSLGVPRKDMIINPEPKDTYEEALFCKTIVKDKMFVLVTSASHMSRSMKLFENMGMNPVAAPTDFKSSGISSHIPEVRSLSNSSMAIHEYLGILWAKIRA